MTVQGEDSPASPPATPALPAGPRTCTGRAPLLQTCYYVGEVSRVESDSIETAALFRRGNPTMKTVALAALLGLIGSAVAAEPGWIRIHTAGKTLLMRPDGMDRTETAAPATSGQQI